jgi:hypothetical protein
VKERNLRLLREAAERATLRIVPKSRVVEIAEPSVRIEAEGRAFDVPNDDVVVRIGGEPAAPLLARAGVRTVRKSIPVAAGETAHG